MFKEYNVTKDNTKDLINNLLRRAQIRRQAKDRKSVTEGKPDRLAELLEDAAHYIDVLGAYHEYTLDNHLPSLPSDYK